MKMLYYVLGTVIYYVLIVGGAVLIEDISTIFNFISAISISLISFGQPAIFYLEAKRQFAADKETPKYPYYLSYVFYVVAVINFILGTTANILGIVQSN